MVELGERIIGQKMVVTSTLGEKLAQMSFVRQHTLVELFVDVVKNFGSKLGIR